MQRKTAARGFCMHRQLVAVTRSRSGLPPRSASSTTPLSAAISSLSRRGRFSDERADEPRWRNRSRSRLPMPTIHPLSRADRSDVVSSSGPWYGIVRRRLRGGALGASGGGVGGARCVDGSKKDTMRELCRVTGGVAVSLAAWYVRQKQAHVEQYCLFPDIL